jgi:hypothetical protein
VSGKLTRIALLLIGVTCILHSYAFPHDEPMARVILFILGGANIILALIRAKKGKPDRPFHLVERCQEKGCDKTIHGHASSAWSESILKAKVESLVD